MTKKKHTISIDALEEALRKNLGFVTYAAKALGCTQSNVTQRIQKSKHLQAVQDEVVGENLDIAEHSLMELIKEKNLGAICFYLKCKGKGRGYVESVIASSTNDDISKQLSELAKKLPV